MTVVTRADVETALKSYVDPYLEQDLVAAKCLGQVRIENGHVELDVEFHRDAPSGRRRAFGDENRCPCTEVEVQTRDDVADRRPLRVIDGRRVGLRRLADPDLRDGGGCRGGIKGVRSLANSKRDRASRGDDSMRYD